MHSSCALHHSIFSLYLFLGLLGKNNLRILSGFPPPEFYSIIEKKESKR